MALPTPSILTDASVVSEDECSLGGFRFRLATPPRRMLTSIQAPRFTIGDTQRGADQRSSILTLNDWRGGIGVQRGLDSTTADRSWWSDMQTRFKEHLVLPRKPVQTVAVDATAATITSIDDLANAVYVTKGAIVYKYNNASPGWGSALDTLPDNVVSSLSDRIGSTVYLVYFHTGGYTYTTDGSSFTDKTTNGSYGVVWRNQLWMIDNTGQLKSNYDITDNDAWETDAQLPVPDGATTGLFISRDASGEFIIYAATNRGIFAHDADAKLWHPTEPRFPRHTKGALGSNDWSEAIYVPVGLSVYKRIIGSGGATSTVMGPDRDHGIPSEYRGAITTSTASHNELLIGTSPRASDEIVISGGAISSGQGSMAFFDTSDITGDGYAVIMGWNDNSWEVKWVAGDFGQDVTALFVTDAYSAGNIDVYRLWWGFGASVYYMDIEADIVNPDEITDQVYHTAGTHITPNFDGGDVTHEKLAIDATFITKNLSSGTRQIAVYYDINFENDWTLWTTLTSDGKQTVTFDDSSSNPVGLTFSEIQFKFVFSGAFNATTSPDMPMMELRWREKLNPKYGWQLTIDHTEEYGGLTPDEQREAIQGCVAHQYLLQFTYKYEDSDQTYWVDATNLTSMEATGLDNAGQTTVSVVET
jgi:hypothetical protein